MDNLLNPDIGLVVWTITTFLILVVVLGKFAWKPMIKTLQDREIGIRRAIDDANMARQTAEELKRQYQQALEQGNEKAQQMLTQAKADAQKLREQLLKEAEADASRLAEQSRRQLEEEKERLLRELRQETAAISVRVAEKLLKHSMNAKEQDVLVQRFLSDIEKDAGTN